jgi:hypothetical protein
MLTQAQAELLTQRSEHDHGKSVLKYQPRERLKRLIGGVIRS